jgi:hypothetical protein
MSVGVAAATPTSLPRTFLRCDCPTLQVGIERLLEKRLLENRSGEIVFYYMGVILNYNTIFV